MGWKDFGDTAEQDDKPAITLGDMRDGETVEVTVLKEPELFSSDYADGDEDDALRVPVQFHESDYSFDTDDGPVNSGDDVVLVTWSRRLGAALRHYAEDNDGLVGERIEIQKFGHDMGVQYQAVGA